VDVDDFIGSRRPQWERLSQLLARGGRRGSGPLSAEEVAEVARLYRLAASDLARAKLLQAPGELLRYLNDLVGRGHAYIYRSRPTSWGSVWEFYAEGFPQLFRRRWPYVAVATGVFLVFALGAFLGVSLNSGAAYSLLPEPVLQFIDRRPPRELGFAHVEELAPILSSYVMTNNIGVSFRAYGLGILFGIGTVYVLAVNGVMVGALAAHFHRCGLAVQFWSLILPHGVLELTAIFIACGSGLLLGHVLLCPGELTRRGALLRAAPEALRLLLGVLPLLVVAGIIEGFVTPTPLAGWLKCGLGGLAGVTALAYLLLAGR
jgi:uncharacterized membrane protein SpoIIM required for sporulation